MRDERARFGRVFRMKPATDCPTSGVYFKSPVTFELLPIAIEVARMLESDLAWL